MNIGLRWPVEQRQTRPLRDPLRRCRKYRSIWPNQHGSSEAGECVVRECSVLALNRSIRTRCDVVAGSGGFGPDPRASRSAAKGYFCRIVSTLSHAKLIEVDIHAITSGHQLNLLYEDNRCGSSRVKSLSIANERYGGFDCLMPQVLQPLPFRKSVEENPDHRDKDQQDANLPRVQPGSCARATPV